jgi:hypothetical protein
LYFFLNILFFNFWEKRDVERKIVGEKFEKGICGREIVGKFFGKIENM